MSRFFLIITLLLVLTLPVLTSAGVVTGGLSNVQTAGAGYSAADEYSAARIAGSVISAFLSLLGTIFLGYLLYGGFKWMTAGGNDDEVKTAQSIIRQAVIGLIIILAAYAIQAFVISSVGKTVVGA